MQYKNLSLVVQSHRPQEFYQMDWGKSGQSDFVCFPLFQYVIKMPFWTCSVVEYVAYWCVLAIPSSCSYFFAVVN